MKQLHTVSAPKKNKNVIQVQVDPTKVPNMDRKYGYLKNKAQVFDDRRFRKPKHKKPYEKD